MSSAGAGSLRRFGLLGSRESRKMIGDEHTGLLGDVYRTDRTDRPFEATRCDGGQSNNSSQRVFGNLGRRVPANPLVSSLSSASARCAGVLRIGNNIAQEQLPQGRGCNFTRVETSPCPETLPVMAPSQPIYGNSLCPAPLECRGKDPCFNACSNATLVPPRICHSSNPRNSSHLCNFSNTRKRRMPTCSTSNTTVTTTSYHATSMCREDQETPCQACPAVAPCLSTGCRPCCDSCPSGTDFSGRCTRTYCTQPCPTTRCTVPLCPLIGEQTCSSNCVCSRGQVCVA